MDCASQDFIKEHQVTEAARPGFEGPRSTGLGRGEGVTGRAETLVYTCYRALGPDDLALIDCALLTDFMIYIYFMNI